jgi:predicted ATPase
VIITKLKLKNWRNFRDIDVNLIDRTYLLGPNAAGKSNFLDVFRFLRDVCKAQGGGLQKAMADRGGVQKVRCLHARKDPEIRMEIHFAEEAVGNEISWKYVLGIKQETKGKKRTLITTEQVWRNNVQLLNRPDANDLKDTLRLTQTALEQIQANNKFRPVVDFFAETTYLHLVPQLLKYGDLIGGKRLDDDPFGQGFLERVAKTPERIRNARLTKIEKALQSAVPQFSSLRFIKDPATGTPHIEALYQHHRPNAGWQREEHFSDGTLRLIALFWILLDGDSMLLLEEPELSLNDAIVTEIPLIIQRVMKTKRHARQIIISTHSHALLDNNGIDENGVLLLVPSAEGTKARQIDSSEKELIQNGLSIAEVMLPKAKPQDIEKLRKWE